MRSQTSRLQDLSTSRTVTQVGVFLARHAPDWIGRPLGVLVASIIAHRKPVVYQTVLENLRQVLGPGARSEMLHSTARAVFAHALQSYYDFFRAVGQPQDVVARTVRLPGAAIARMQAARAQGRGVLLLGTHMSNFDLGMMAIKAQGFPIQLLSLADPPPGFHILNELRTRAGSEVTPITPEALRLAVRRLKNAGMVITGLDRPVARDSELVECFGRESYLPLGPVRLALMADPAVFVGSCYHESGKGYGVDIEGPVDMVRSDDRRWDILSNARRLGALLERQVRACPEQWMMFHPFWPPREVGGESTAAAHSS